MQVVLARGNHLFYKCVICNKYYQHLSDAQLCLENCISRHPVLTDGQKQQLSHIWNLKTTDFKKKEGWPSFFTTQMPHDLTLDMRADLLPFSEESSPGYDRSDVKGDQPQQSPKARVQQRSPGQKAFVRMDASYECTVCHSRYFTKNEVEECFLKHPVSE